jgi:hypothetical protein
MAQHVIYSWRGQSGARRWLEAERVILVTGLDDLSAVRVFLLPSDVRLMDYGLGAFFIFVAAVAFMLHWLSRRFLVVSIGGAVLCSVVALWYSAWVANYEVNFGWVPIMLIWLFVYALPVTLVVGLPFLALRGSRYGTRKPVKAGVMDEL